MTLTRVPDFEGTTATLTGTLTAAVRKVMPVAITRAVPAVVMFGPTPNSARPGSVYRPASSNSGARCSARARPAGRSTSRRRFTCEVSGLNRRGGTRRPPRVAPRRELPIAGMSGTARSSPSPTLSTSGDTSRTRPRRKAKSALPGKGWGRPSDTLMHGVLVARLSPRIERADNPAFCQMMIRKEQAMCPVMFEPAPIGFVPAPRGQGVRSLGELRVPGYPSGR
jgi:hypothetical protein